MLRLLKYIILLLQYKKFKLLLKLRNGKKNIDILHVQKTYDSYSIPKL